MSSHLFSAENICLVITFLLHICREEEGLVVFNLENVTICIQDVYMMLLQITSFQKS